MVDRRLATPIALSIFVLAAPGCRESVDLSALATTGGGNTNTSLLPTQVPTSVETGNVTSPVPPGPGGEQGPGSNPPICQEQAVRSCAQTSTGVPIEFPGGSPKGSCKEGSQTCTNGAWGPCQGAIAPKAKDTCEPGNDDNCNGLRNDHCTCVAGVTQPCGTSIGACQEGVQRCRDDGTWDTTCEGEVGPTSEQCNGEGIDEDCDAAADLEDADCSCNEGELRPCTTPKLGDCNLGVQTCRQGQWDPKCVPRFEPTEEICGPRKDPSAKPNLPKPTGDEDCDGRVDESDADNGYFPKGPEHLGVYFMLDTDKDGWGAMAGPGEKDSDVARRYCVGRENDAPGGWTRAGKDKLQRDCGDCRYDGDEVGPDYNGGFQKKPNSCLESRAWRGGPFDYNCSGKEEKEVEELHRCDPDPETCLSTRRGGWKNINPPCGESAEYIPREDCQAFETDDPNDPNNMACQVASLVLKTKVQACQ